MSTRPALLEAIRLATLAPSSHNAQPWTFVMEEDGVVIFPDLSRRLPVVDPDDHALYISLGCALENLVLGASHAGLAPAVELFPDAHPSGLTVHVHPADAGPNRDDLVAAIGARQTTRRAFRRRPIPPEHLAALVHAGQRDGVSLHVATLPTQIAALARLVETATRAQFRDRAFVDELVTWMRFNRKEALARGDGLTWAAQGYPQVRRWFGTLVMKVFTTAAGQARRAGRLVRASSAVLVLAVREDDRRHWVEVGRSFERVALTATALGIRHAHANMPCEVPAVRRQLQDFLALGPSEPLLLVRLGYARRRPRSPRRPLDDVVVRRPVARPATQASSGR